MADSMRTLVNTAYAATDKVNEFVLLVANASIFSTDKDATSGKLQKIVEANLGPTITAAQKALVALSKAIQNEREARFHRARSAIELLVKELLPEVEERLTDSTPRAQLVVLSKRLTQSTLVVKRIFEGISNGNNKSS